MIMGEWGRRKRKRSHRRMNTMTKINTTCEREASGPEVTAMRRTKELNQARPRSGNENRKRTGMPK
jgi:hypothetical protein